MEFSVPQMVCQALGLPPYREEKSQEETRCSFCGGRIAKGDPCKTRALSALSDSFTNDSSLACRSSNIACQWCPPLAKKDVLLKTPNSLVTPDGLYGLAKDENRTWFFLTPPSPPWAAFFVTSKMAHVAWRTPLTLDNSLMVMRLDDQILHIRRDRLMRAIDDCKRAGALLAQENGNVASTKKTKPEFVRNHPFIVLDREAFASQHGQFLPKFTQLADCNEEAAGIASRLELLTKGELFALATLVKGKPVPPVAPQRITLC